MRTYLTTLAVGIAIWIAFALLVGWHIAFALYLALVFAMEARRRWKLRQLKKHPLYYLIAIEQEFGGRR